VRADGSMVGPTRTRPATRSGWRTASSTATWQPKELPSTATDGRSAASSQSGQVVGVLNDIQDLARVAAEPEAGQVDHVDRVVPASSAASGIS
jgi:hypothetical protein